MTGSTIGGYKLLELVGAGGMGEVYRAQHVMLGRTAAVKILSRNDLNGPNAKRFFQEARLQASLRHPGLAAVYDFIEQDTQLCIAMEFVEGPTLNEYIRTRGPLPAKEALEILQQITAAVQYVHSQGIVHRDIKSSNIKVSADGRIKLLDFGIASALRSPGLTSPGTVVGTFEYVAPEQLEGKPASERSDIWALGILLYEMTTAHLPFEANSITELCGRIAQGDFAKPSLRHHSVPFGIDLLVARCLERNPSDRFQSTVQLQEEIERHWHGPSSKRNARTANLFPRVPARLRKPILIASLVVTFLLAAGLLLWRQTSSPRSGFLAVSVDVVNGPAEVFREGQDLGATPAKIEGRWGEHVSLIIKRNGFEDLPIDFEVNERPAYSYVLRAASSAGQSDQAK